MVKMILLGTVIGGMCLISIISCGKKHTSRPVTSNIFNGSTNLHDQTFATLTINGSAHLTNIKITQALYANGAFTAHQLTSPVLQVNGGATLENATLDSLTANGSLHITDSKVKQTTLNGSLQALNSTFDTLSVAATEVCLDNTQVETIVVRPTKHNVSLFGIELWNSSKEQTVILRNGTVVRGNITFEAKGGKVILESGATLRGKIIDGETV